MQFSILKAKLKKSSPYREFPGNLWLLLHVLHYGTRLAVEERKEQF